MYLLRTAIADVEAGTYHGSCGVRIIATIKPVRRAPLGNSQAPRTLRRITPSIRTATPIALATPGAISLIPSPSGAENECGGGERVRQHRGGADDGHAGDGIRRRSRAWIDDVVAVLAGAPALVISRRAPGQVGNAERVDQLMVEAWMTYSDRPLFAVRIAPTEIEVTAGIDRKVLERPQLARGHIDCEPFRNRAEIENQRAAERDRLSIRIQVNVSIAHGAARLQAGSDDLAGAIFAAEAARLHVMADGGIEGAPGLLRHGQREVDRFVEHLADRYGVADPCGELHQLAVRIKSSAALFDAAKPTKRALDRFFLLEGLFSIGSMADDLDRHQRAHGRDGLQVLHFAFDRASATASATASVLCVAPET